MINDTLQKRRYIIAIFMSAIILVYIIQLFNIQILDSKYKEGAESNALLRKTLYPSRGLIYDRNNNLLVFNKPAYDVTFIAREIHDLDTTEFCNSLHISKKFFIKRMKNIRNRRLNPGYSSYTPQVFLTQLSVKEIAELQQSLYKFPGFDIQNRTLREYTYPIAAHVLGSIGEVSQRTINKDPYYSVGDYCGRSGIEYTYEKQLRGKKGVEILLRDAKGRIKGRYENGKDDIPPVAGQNLTLTLDYQLQMLAEKLLNGKVGSIVAIQPKTGEILAMATSPSFDPNLLVGRQRSKNYYALLHDPTKPLMNRATQGQYSPGSSFKPVSALVCQQMGGITKHTIFTCNGPNSTPIKCSHFHGTNISLLDAIAESCNPYFWNAFKSTVEKDGYGPKNEYFRKNYDEWVDRIKSFGLGEKFHDSDVFDQARGYIPTDKFYNRVYRSVKGWKAITIRSDAIGQGEIMATPLQLAVAMTAIANQGYYITPHLLKCDSMLQKIHHCKVDKKYFPIVFKGMYQVFQYGTASASNLAGIEMCGKTGTVQTHGKDHAFFVGFAPRDNPQIAISVIVEHSGYGATYAAPIFSLLVEQYLTGTIKRVDLENRIINLVTNAKVKER